MSGDRFRDPQQDSLFPDGIPRVKRNNLHSFMGEHRPPFYPDESDAETVVDLYFPEPDRARLKFVHDTGDWLRVVSLPAL